MNGIVLDQRYSDSVLKTLIPRTYSTRRRIISVSHAAPKRDVLATLLLHGKAYLSKPYWLKDREFPEINEFVNEDLIEWIPDDRYEGSTEFIGRFLVLAQDVADKAWELHAESRFINLDEKIVDEQVRLQSMAHKLRIIGDDLDWMMRELLYYSPVVRANLRHLRAKTPNPLVTLLFPFSEIADGALRGQWFPDDAFGHLRPDAFRNLSEEERDDALRSLKEIHSEMWSSYDQCFYGRLSYLVDRKNGLPEELQTWGGSLFDEEQAKVLDACMSSRAAEKFASQNGLPLKTYSRDADKRLDVFGVEEYELIKVQFAELRYPVIETIDDVLRLRDDPNLRRFREVISEYAARLRLEIEEERFKVLSEFRSDIHKALNSFAKFKTISKMVDWVFYISIPLAIVGMLSGLPLSDIIAIPSTLYAKKVTASKRRELDWIMFGRPEGM